MNEHGVVLRVNTTVVAVVAVAGVDPLDGVRAANVRIVRPEADPPALDRAILAWEQVRRTSTLYTLHDADPLAWVADAWVRRFDGQGAVGELEVAVAETLSRWRARSLDLPDYYLVVNPEAFASTMRHWFLGVVRPAAPTRVVVVRPSISLADQLGQLRPGPWWPDLDRMLADLDRVVPDQAGAPTGTPAPPGLVTPEEARADAERFS
jgi:hypothetical protein